MTELDRARNRLHNRKEVCEHLQRELEWAMFEHMEQVLKVLELERLIDPPERRPGESMDRRVVTEETVRHLIREAYGRS